MATTIVTAKRFSLKLNDWWKGLILAILAPALKVIIDSINEGSLAFNWGSLWKVSVAAGAAYLLKNLFDSPKIVMTGATPEQVQAVKEGDAEIKVVNK